MAKSKQNHVAKRAPASLKVQDGQPRSLAISDRGIKTGAHFADLMSAMMSDIISGRITPAVGNAACNAGGKLLKVVEMQYKFGTQSGNQGDKTLILASD
jgi:hypothetical protein